MADIFISYAREDRTKVKPFVELLEQQGWSVWWDREVVPGHSFGAEIDKQLADASCVVVFWSRHSVGASWVQAEANEGLERGILVPVALEDVRPPLVFRHVETVPLHGWPARDSDAELQRLMRAIGGVIGARTDELNFEYNRSASNRYIIVGLGALLLVFTLGLGAFVWFGPEHAAGSKAPMEERVETLEPAPSIAIMPFSGLETDIAPELSRLLAGTGVFFIENAEHVKAYLNDPDGIDLNARYAVQGSVDNGSLEVSLFDRNEGKALWNQAFKLQDFTLPQLTQSVATRISNVFNRTSVRVDDVSHDVYLSYLQAKAQLREANDLDALQEVEALFIETIEQAPRFGEGYAGLCETYTFMYIESKKVDYFEEAERRCFRAATLSDHDFRVDVALGRLYSIAGQYDMALKHLQRAMEAAPFSTEVLREMALTKYRQNEISEAVELLTLAQAREPNYWRNYEELARIYFQTGQYLKAAQQYERMLAVGADEFRVLNNLGSAYYLAEKFDQAVEAWRASLSFSEAAPALSNLGSAYFFNGEFDKAADAYLRATELRPTDARLWANAGDAIMQTGGDPERYFKKSVDLALQQLAISPDDAMLLSILGSSYAALDERAESMHFIDRALSARGDDVYVLYHVAVALNRLNKPDRRDKVIERMVAQGYSKTLIERDANF